MGWSEEGLGLRCSCCVGIPDVAVGCQGASLRFFKEFLAPLCWPEWGEKD